MSGSLSHRTTSWRVFHRGSRKGRVHLNSHSRFMDRGGANNVHRIGIIDKVRNLQWSVALHSA